MFRPLSLLSLFLCWSVAVGFAPASSMTKPISLSFHTPLQMSEQAPPEQQDDPNASNNIELALKMVGVLAIKTVKDVVNYPPMMLDQVLRDAQQNNTKLPQTSPLVMLVKLMGVLLFKTVHDALYYPALWTERMIECQSLEECELK